MARPPSKTRRQRLEEREDSLLDAAHAEFSASGFDGAKMAAIARRANVAEGTVYLYFKNKHALLEAVTSRFYARLTEGAERGVARLDDTFERLAFLARYHVRECMAERPMLELMLGRYRRIEDYDDRGYAFNKAYVAVFDRAFREGVTRGELRDDVPLWIARDTFYGTLEYALRTLLLRRSGKAQCTRAVSQAMALFRRGVARDAAGAADDAPELDAVARRLEAVAERLEAAR